MVGHIDVEKEHWKKRYFIVSLWWQKSHFFASLPIAFCKAIFGENHPTTRRYHVNALVFSGIFIFPNFKLLSTGISGWIQALYIEATENIPLPVRFQRKTLDPWDNWTESRRCNKSFHDACLVPKRLRRNDTFGGEVSNTLAIVPLLWRTILYNDGYCSRSVEFS
jgi:hypothetical protein